ncbi:CMRF35-like molecule 7 isoform X1 [Anolis carolinensis]|uniref:CMRF35-like molecule 7 isoform X1 n=1 Tax=Anolis carolinensis TaxID=28377 RepID=UPI002F2B8142
MRMGNQLQWHLTVGALFLLTDFTSALVGPEKVPGFLDNPLSLVCTYEKGFKNYIKYWCKGAEWSSCTTIVKTDGTEAVEKKGRTKIKDNQTNFKFTVTLENLTEKDAGKYWCAIERALSDIGVLVTIEVLPVPTTIPVITTSLPTEPNFSSITTERPIGPDSLDNLTILLPVVFLVLVVILTGALLLMWRLKKKKAAKECKDVPLSMSLRQEEQNTSSAVVKPRFNHKEAPSEVNQAMNYNPAEVEYTSVTIRAPTTAAASPSQVHTNTENIAYASLRFSTPNEQAIYANVK